MQRSPPISSDRLTAIALLVGGTIFGLLSESAAYGFRHPGRWIPDALVGLGFLVGGVASLPRRRGVGVLLVATGLSWWLGNFITAALYLHRGTLFHAVVLFPGWITRSNAQAVLLASAYAAAVTPALGGSDLGTAIYGLVLAGIAVLRFTEASGHLRHLRLDALRAALVVLMGTTGAAAFRLATSAGPAAVVPTLHVYEAALAGAAILLWRGSRLPSAASLADLVVELDASSSGSLRETLARLLGDPLLAVGLQTEAGEYVDASGVVIDLPRGGGDRVATIVTREEGSNVAIVHDRSLLQEGGLLDAVASVTKLSEANAALNAETRAQIAALAASRHRLLSTEDEERRLLAARLRRGPGTTLSNLEAVLAQIVDASTDALTRTATERALGQLQLTRRDLDSIAQGLHPHELDGRLDDALRGLAARLSLAADVSVTDAAIPPALTAAVYYICAEALTNVAKHASAGHVEVWVSATAASVELVVADDGVGGADIAAGTGLRGLADRVGAFGGTLTVSSPTSGGTRLVAELPLGDQSDPTRPAG